MRVYLGQRLNPRARKPAALLEDEVSGYLDRGTRGRVQGDTGNAPVKDVDNLADWIATPTVRLGIGFSF